MSTSNLTLAMAISLALASGAAVAQDTTTQGGDVSPQASQHSTATQSDTNNTNTTTSDDHSSQANTRTTATDSHAMSWSDSGNTTTNTPTTTTTNDTWNTTVAATSTLSGTVSGNTVSGIGNNAWNTGNSNGAKFDLNQNYLKYAQDSGRSAVFAGHRSDVGRRFLHPVAARRRNRRERVVDFHRRLRAAHDRHSGRYADCLPGLFPGPCHVRV